MKNMQKCVFDYTLLTEYSVSKGVIIFIMTNDTNANDRTKRVRRDRREEILQAASELFSVHGFRGTSLSSIAEAVDLTEPGLLHYFPSKVHLLQEVLAYLDEQDEEKYSSLFDPENVSLEEYFHLMEDLVTQNETKPGLVRLFTILVGESIRNDHPSHEYFVNRYSQTRAVFAELLLTLPELDIHSDVNLDDLVTLIIAVMDGMQTQWLLDPENVNMSQSFKLFSAIVVGYLTR
jgi:AcrR family transcriptional regulator